MATTKRIVKAKVTKPKVEVIYPVRTVDHNGAIHYKNKLGLHHRLDGPALEYRDGSKYWMVDGRYHREDGPAMSLSDKTEYYYLEGSQYQKINYDLILKKNRLVRALASLEKFADKFGDNSPDKAGVAVINFLRGECDHKFVNEKNECELCDN